MLFKAPMPDTPDHPDRNRRKLHGRRKGPKLSGRQADLRMLGRLPDQMLAGAKTDLQPHLPNAVRKLAQGIGTGGIGQFA